MASPQQTLNFLRSLHSDYRKILPSKTVYHGKVRRGKTTYQQHCISLHCIMQSQHPPGSETEYDARKRHVCANLQTPVKTRLKSKYQHYRTKLWEDYVNAQQSKTGNVIFGVELFESFYREVGPQALWKSRTTETESQMAQQMKRTNAAYIEEVAKATEPQK